MNSSGNSDDYIASELNRLNGEREKLYRQRNEIDDKLTGVEREVGAIEAYRNAKNGTMITSVGRGIQVGYHPHQRRRRSSRREALLNLIKQNPEGMRRGDILEKMGLKGDKSGEMSVSNALTAMVKKKQVSREGGKYKAV